MSEADICSLAVLVCDHLMTKGIDRVDAMYAVWALSGVRLTLHDDHLEVAEWLCEVEL